MTPPDRSLAATLPHAGLAGSASSKHPAPPSTPSSSPLVTPSDAVLAGDAAQGRAAAAAPFWERWRDRWYRFVATASFQRWAAGFPLTRPVALHRSRALFDLMSGFVYTQTLYSCVELGLFDLLAKGPLTVEQIAARHRMPVDSIQRLVAGAVSLRLLSRRRSGCIALGPLGAVIVDNTALLALIRHHAMVYADLADPVSLLRNGSDFRTELSRYWSYADAPRPQAIDDTRVASYSEMMAATLPAARARRARRLRPLEAPAGARHRRRRGRVPLARRPAAPGAPAHAFRSPRGHHAARGPGCRRPDWPIAPTYVGGNFHADPLPTGADVATLVRVLLDHDDESVARLLRKVHDALPKGGTLLVAEAMAGAKGAEPVGDAYFNFYLLAMGKGRARRPEELHAMLRAAGFRKSRAVTTRYPIQTGLIVAEA